MGTGAGVCSGRRNARTHVERSPRGRGFWTSSFGVCVYMGVDAGGLRRGAEEGVSTEV